MFFWWEVITGEIVLLHGQWAGHIHTFPLIYQCSLLSRVHTAGKLLIEMAQLIMIILYFCLPGCKSKVAKETQWLAQFFNILIRRFSPESKLIWISELIIFAPLSLPVCTAVFIKPTCLLAGGGEVGWWETTQLERKLASYVNGSPLALHLQLRVGWNLTNFNWQNKYLKTDLNFQFPTFSGFSIYQCEANSEAVYNRS